MSGLGKISIQTGFSMIRWLEEPRKSTIDKGKLLAQANHICDVEEIHEPNKSIEISARCIRQTSVTEQPWRLNLLLDDNRNITRAFCSCPAGGEGNCKHVAALFEFINTEREESKTDQKCRFNAPSQRGKKLYPKGKSFDEIFQLKSTCPNVSFQNVSKEAKLEQYQEMLEAGNTASPLFKICGLQLQNLQIAEESGNQAILSDQKDPDLPVWVKDKVFASEDVSPDNYQKIAGAAFQYYSECVQISQDKAMKLCSLTTDQSASSLWRTERKLRVTASKAHQIWRARKEHTRLEYFSSSRSLDGIESLRYGIDLEGEARGKYGEVTGNLVFVPGMVVKSSYSWLAASPDGLFLDTDGNVGLLEIKCPFSCKDSNIDVPYIKGDQLNRKDRYYAQVQIGMFVTGAKVTDFFVYSRVDYKLIKVPRDDTFI